MHEFEKLLYYQRHLDNPKYRLRHWQGETLMEVVINHTPDDANHYHALFRRVYHADLDFPELELFRQIRDPNELVAIAKMALLAWEQFVDLQAADRKLEPAREV